MTLDEMIQETASYIDETLIKSNGQYTNAAIYNKLVSAINYAYKKICREKYKLLTTEAVSVINGELNTNTLSKKFLELSTVESSEGYIVDYELKGDVINVPFEASAVVSYYFMPEDLINLEEIPLLPESNIDHKLLCFYAAFQYLMMEQDSNAAAWLNMWNDGFESIRQKKNLKIRIKHNVGW